jgi:hypothetical protein
MQFKYPFSLPLLKYMSKLSFHNFNIIPSESFSYYFLWYSHIDVTFLLPAIHVGGNVQRYLIQQLWLLKRCASTAVVGGCDSNPHS